MGITVKVPQTGSSATWDLVTLAEWAASWFPGKYNHPIDDRFGVAQRKGEDYAPIAKQSAASDSLAHCSVPALPVRVAYVCSDTTRVRHEYIALAATLAARSYPRPRAEAHVTGVAVASHCVVIDLTVPPLIPPPFFVPASSRPLGQLWRSP